MKQTPRSVTRALAALDAAANDEALPSSQRARWRTLWVRAAALAGERKKRGRPQLVPYSEIRELYGTGLSVPEIAARCKVSVRVVRRALSR